MPAFAKRLLSLTVALALAATAFAQMEHADAYLASFNKQFPVVRTLAEGRAMVTVDAYDDLMLEKRLPGLLGLDAEIDGKKVWAQAYDYLNLDQDQVTNENSAMAWGLSYDHLSLNQMWRATGDTKYLAASWLVSRAVADARDSVRGLKLNTGESAPVWGCSKYVDDGRAVHAVHTGVIAFPVVELLWLLREAPDYDGKPSAAEQQTLLESMEAALTYHDPQWVEGPGDKEGHYIGMNQEPNMEGVVLPANRLAAMGRALLYAAKLSGNATYRDKAEKLGWYLKNRMSIATDKDAYVWPYFLHLDDMALEKPWTELVKDISGEDISHGSLTASFPFLLHEEGMVFTGADMAHLANTVTEVFGRESDGVLYSFIDGVPRKEANPGLLVLPGRWMRIAPEDAGVYAACEAFLLTRNEALRPLDLANLIRYRPDGGDE